MGDRFDLPDLGSSERFPLQCDPLGTRAGLSAEWLARLARLDDTVAGRRKIDLAAIHYVASENPRHGSCDEDPEGVYEFALRYETRTNKPFPRELAAFWSTANGVALNDTFVLYPVAGLTWKGERLCIGCGSYFQGSLVIEASETIGLVDAKVVDRDDDQCVIAEYECFAAFVDAMLGA